MKHTVHIFKNVVNDASVDLKEIFALNILDFKTTIEI